MRIPLPGIEREHGLGDAVKSATSAVGIKPCGGCRKRATALNRAVQFVPRRNAWTAPPAAPDGWRLIDSCGQFVMLERQGEWIIWEIRDGRYFGSRKFSGPSAEYLARQKWEELCR